MNAASVTFREAVLRVREAVRPLPSVRLSLDQICGDVLLEDAAALTDQPPFPRSPLDGYAVKGADTAGASRERPVSLRVVGTIFAGSPEVYPMKNGECVRIMTGGRIPPDADAVVRQEDTSSSGSRKASDDRISAVCGQEDAATGTSAECGQEGFDTVRIFRGVEPWQNYCRAGEDFERGDLLVEKGTILDGTAVSVLAAAGISEALVPARPRVAVLSTGDELTEPGRTLSPGCIYDSNRFGICARLREFGLNPISAHIGDDQAAAEEKILSLLRDHDLVITTGGISVGQKDILVQVLDDLKKREGHSYQEVVPGLRMKPGSPSRLVLIDGRPLLCLSGNPYASAAVFELIGREVMSALTLRPLSLREDTAILQGSFPKASPVERFLRAKISRLPDGRLAARIGSGHSSGQIRSMLGCSGFVDLAAGSPPAEEGQSVVIWHTVP